MQRESEISLEKPNNQKNLEEEENLKRDPVEARKAKEVVLFFEKTFSIMKLYPPENLSVKNSIRSFGRRIEEFLDQYEELRIGIKDFSFSFEGETIFRDEEKRRSLPFLFFKDGVRELCFHEGLDTEELQDFLETIKRDSDLPPGDSDIVNSLWEKDFAHIRYFAPDEFLESDIGRENGEAGLKIDRGELSSGVIELTPEDRKETYERSLALRLHLDKDKEEDRIEPPSILAAVSEMATISEGNITEIESMLSTDREGSRAAELVTLLFEILFLEDEHDQFLGTLDILDQCHQELVHKADFAQAVSLLNHVLDLGETLSSQSEEKKKLLYRIPNKAKQRSSLSSLKQLFLEGRIVDFDSFFQYLKVLGPDTVSLVGDIWEESEDSVLRLKALNLLKELGQQDINSLVSIAHDNRVSLTKEIIAIMGRIGNRKVVPHLEHFAGHQDKAIRLETVQSLRKIDDEAANKTLLKFLSDEDREVRTVAAMNLDCFGDKTALETVMELALKKDFKKKSKIEKKALLHFLARTQSDEVYPLFRSILKKSSILSRSRQNETRLCAV